jgi:hypothetical protein
VSDQPEATSPAVLLQRLISGYTISQAVYVAAKLGVADLVAERPLRVEEVAAATGADPPSLYRFLRALASLAVFIEDDEGRFTTGPLGEFLRADSPGSLRAYAIHANEETYRAWGEALYSARTGEPGFDHVYGTSFYEYMAGNEEANRTWNESMNETERSFAIQKGIIDSYDWSRLRQVVDVGGGQGMLVTAILQQNPHLKGVVFDLPHVLDGAVDLLAQAGVAERAEVVGGDFFESVPRGGDAYLLSRVLFNWEDEAAVAILRSCREAMPDHGRVLVIEPVVAPGNSPDMSKLVDLNVFVVCGGRTRTEPEHRRIMAAAGLSLSRVIATPAYWRIIEAVAANPDQS